MSLRFFSRRALELLHDEGLAEHGGRAGVREAGLLDAALALPHPLRAHGEPDLAALAAAFGVGLVRNLAFVDGNHRAAFLAVGLFLGLNGQRLVTTQADATLAMLALAAGDLGEDEFAHWLRQHLQPRSS